MKSNIYGLVAEFNPFHKGHEYIVNKIKEQDEDAVIVSVMSGHFMQRGIPAIVDKWKRAEMAIRGGVDLVLELPAVYAVQSADVFAAASMKILNNVAADVVAFGSECDSIDEIDSIAELMLYSEEYNMNLRAGLLAGDSYASASRDALKALGVSTVIKANDTLAISYAKQKKKNNYNFKLMTIKRMGSDYNSNEKSDFVSASKVRSIISAKMLDYDYLKSILPSYSYDILYKENCYADIDDFTELFYASILTRTNDELQEFDYSKEGLVNRILKSASTNKSIRNIVRESSTRRYNEAAVSRSVCQMMLGIKPEFISESHASKVDYIRVLGMNAKGKKLLRALSDKNIKVLQNLQRDLKKHNITGEISDYDIKATGLYSLVSHSVTINSDYIRKPYIV